MISVTVDRIAQDDGLLIRLHLVVAANAGEDINVFVTDLSEGAEFVRVASGADLVTVPTATPTPSPTPTEAPTTVPFDYHRVSEITLFFGEVATADSALESLLSDLQKCAEIQAIGLGTEDTFTAYFHQILPVVTASETRVREFLTRKEIAPPFRRNSPAYPTGRLSVHRRDTQDHLKKPLSDNPKERGIQR
jgi:hypothetical protein